MALKPINFVGYSTPRMQSTQQIFLSTASESCCCCIYCDMPWGIHNLVITFGFGRYTPISDFYS